MVKSDNSIAAEFFKLELALVRTADDATKCVKTLKANLTEYDTRHGLHFTNTSKSFMRPNIRATKDAASELRAAADQISKSKYLSDWEIAAARNKMTAASGAVDGLKKAARAYDELNGKPTGITRIIDNVLVRKYDKKKSRNQDENVLETADTAELVVKLTLQSNFSGFSALKHQISIAEKSLAPSLKERAKDAVEDVMTKLKGNRNTWSVSV